MPGLIRGVARTAAPSGTATAVSNRRVAPPGESLVHPGASSGGLSEPEPQGAHAPPPQAAQAPWAVEQLEGLADPRLAGILIEEEFSPPRKPRS